MPLENLIRPFETPRVSPPKAVAVSTVQAAQPVKLAFGRNGAGKTMNGSYASTVTSYCAAAASESLQLSPL